MRKFLIHILGGYTKEEVKQRYSVLYDHAKYRGKVAIAMYILYYAKSLYGKTKQEWIDGVYNKLQELLKEDSHV